MSKLVLFEGKGKKGKEELSGLELPFSNLIKKTQSYTLDDLNRYKAFRKVLEKTFLKEIDKLISQLTRLERSTWDKLNKVDVVRTRDYGTLKTNLKKFFKSDSTRSSGGDEDPWLIEQQMFVSLQNFVGSENVYRSAVCNATVAILTFEKMLLETLKSLLNQYYNQHQNLYS
jgi:hypothetical protein